MDFPEPTPGDDGLRRAVVVLREGMTFEATTGSRHTSVLDAASEHGGSDHGPSPMEMLLVSLGSCTGMDVIAMLRKMKQDVTTYRVEVQGTRRHEHPQVYTAIHVQHVLCGHDLDAKQVARAVDLSSTRYCSVSAMLSAVADVRHTFTIEGESGTAPAS
jgi:putative redox protein